MQIRDVRNLIAVVPDLDWDYIRSWAARLDHLPLLEQATR
jgi:hypothetical protein